VRIRHRDNDWLVRTDVSKPIADLFHHALGAGAVTLIAVVGIIAIRAKHRLDAPVQAKTYGRANEMFTFAADPTGRTGPANDCTRRSAPSLWGIVGAPKARADWFSYSLAFRKKGGVWSEEELDQGTHLVPKDVAGLALSQ